MSTSYLSTDHDIATEQIATRAYHVYLDRIENNIPGNSDTDWLQAEALLAAELEEKATKKAMTQTTRPAKTVKARKTDPEDLKQIKGIGAAFIKKLNAEGIFKISQIAALTQGDVEQLEAKLKCKGRITREKWIDQAKAL